MTIRLKGKHIVMAVALLLVLSGVLYTAGAGALSRQQLAKAEDDWSPQEYLRSLKKLFPNPEDAAKELYFSASDDADGAPEHQRNMVIIFPTSTIKTQPEAEVEGRLDRAAEKLILLREHFPETVWAKHALRVLVRIHYSQGNYGLMEEYALLATKESDWEATGSVQLLARMYLDTGEAAKALELVEESLHRQPGNLALEMMHLQARSLLALGEWDRAADVFRQMPEKATEIYQQNPSHSGDRKSENDNHWEEIARRNLERLAALRQSDGKTGTVVGRVLLGTAGMTGARVYLMDQSVNRTFFSTAELGDMRQAVSGPDGSFRFNDVIPGRYVLGVAVRVPDIQGYTLRQQQEFSVDVGGVVEQILQFEPNAVVRQPLGGEVLEDTVEFSWDAVEGAAYYNLSVTPILPDGVVGGFGSVLRAEVPENRVLLDVGEELHKARFFPSYGHSGGKLNPSSVFGQIYPGGEFAWSVTAFDAGGQKISDSIGYGAFVAENNIPSFGISGEMSPADKLVWAGEYDQAVAAYEESLDANPNDAHALLVLARIHQFGATLGERDLKKAAIYYERLIKLEDTPEARRALARVRSDLRHFYEAYGLYQTLMGTHLEGWDTHYELAKAEFQLGLPESALERLNRAVGMEYGQYARAYPVALALVLGEEEQALTFARKVDGGDRYLELLAQYVQVSTPNHAFSRSVADGDYRAALSVLTDSNEGQFRKILLNYLLHGPNTEEVKKVVMNMEKGLSQNLLLQMLVYH